MKLYIDQKELDLLLERKREFIGTKQYGFVGIINAVLLLFSALTTEYGWRGIPAETIKTIFCLVAIVNIGVAVWQIYKAGNRNYTKEMLLKDIEELDMKNRRSSIIAIKNPVNPRKFLVYYDKQWGFLLFPNYVTSDYENEESLREKLSADLDVDPKEIEIRYQNTGGEEKYATAHQEMRSYEYSFYCGNVKGIQETDFEIDGRRYSWMTIQEMLDDPETKEYNQYIVEHIRNSF